MIKYAEGLKVVPIIAPQAFTTTAIHSQYVDMSLLDHFSALVQFGGLTSDSTDTVTVTVVACATNPTSDAGTAINFDYRLSQAIGTDSTGWGDITGSTSTGVVLTAAANDNMSLFIDVDPAAVANGVTNGRYIAVVITPSAEMATSYVSASAICETRYMQNKQLSSS